MFLRDLFRLLPRNPLRRALGALNRGEFDHAAALLENILRGEARPAQDLCVYACEAYQKAGQQRREAGDVAGALRCLQRAAALCPTFADVHFHLAELYEHCDQPEPARRAYEQALVLNPRYFQARLALARLLTHCGDTDSALRQLQDAAAAAPEASAALSGWLAAHATSAADAQAHLETFFTTLASTPPSVLEAGVEKARRALRTGDQRRAITALQSLLGEHAGYPDLHNLLGVAYDTAGMLDDAVEEFERAVTLNPDYAEARMNLGVALFHRGRHEEAARHLTWVEKKHPGHELVRNVLAQITSATSRR